ncbi:hypothetical protein [Kribbella pratensis]|uniref:DUF2637 domain-containing protein n=1 Tax=Kribbella pratensis TaxID=2512112 RepID=A0A4R8BV33_9ACTN|nr:hypothetical protein [Kribbella pratensis]TDW65624.1 hypothetical protein EV653_5635 [Kribbella pratensis]
MTATEIVAASNGETDSKSSGVDKLRASAAEASQVRALSTHPDVVALRVEAVRTQVDRCMWFGIVLGLAFTMVNVQAFAAQGAELWSLPWFAAWLLDPMVSLVLIAVLRAEQITARYQVFDDTKWISWTKGFAFAATYAMNTWGSFGHRDVAGVVLHSVPPLLVYCAAETAPVLRDRLTEAVLRAERAAALADPQKAAERLDTSAEIPAALDTVEAAQTGGQPGEQPEAAGDSKKPSRKSRKRVPEKAGRKLLADYVTEGVAAIEGGEGAGLYEITPAWARKATGCSAGLSAKVAAGVRDVIASTQPTTTDETTEQFEGKAA